MAHFIDRRLNGKNKSTLNRQRFIRRYKKQIKEAVSDAINKRSVTDTSSGESISIPQRDISEPIFHQGKGGDREQIHPGNDQFSTGDKIQRPQGGQGGGAGEGEASDSGEGQDDFVFSISKDEYLDLLFEDLELPNLQQNQLDKLVKMKTHRAGFCSDGMPSNIDIVRSLQGSLARRVAMSASKKRRLNELNEQLAILLAEAEPDLAAITLLEQEIAQLELQIKAVPFIDNYDLRFRNYEKQPHPTSKAVMFCIMDVSGSMDQATKDMAKRFYILLYQFLTRSYKDIEVVYIRHHTQAKEVDEQEFFYSQETGGTIVSSALKLMNEIIKERYNASQWNIYAAQASDGDNWADDSPQCSELLRNKLLDDVRYYAYIEITTRAHQSLWREYQNICQSHDNFAMQHIKTVGDIYPIFRELFKKSRQHQGAA
ncbi:MULTISPECIES: YeaH/YhbH family protein [unclassified Pseudoalteromonas]|uniref:YeaH/YhbH family protein n=1 Tax=unclassified Pseudoalteromonas TaxID=194690 RepID=UPI0025B2EA6D|nr:MULTISPECIES: YeaH/YhbH family protein [unclassified Pseudoalteromonas]MDN3380160.1 YeaH/YhbH family protein [Pseudoalteromonas sp. APC 3893]MDN3388425.1 YeaH/YhbH family protein [Pseudoalteromonas sp. APC 4017]